jgi:hypothetical protein
LGASGKAKQAAEADVQKALGKTGVTMDEVRAYLAKHPRLAGSLYRAPHSAACTAADLVYDVAHRINTPAYQRATRATVTAARALGGGVVRAARRAPALLGDARKAGAEIFEIARDEKVVQRAKGRFLSLDEKVVQRAKGRFLSLVLRGPSAERGALAAAAR